MKAIPSIAIVLATATVGAQKAPALPDVLRVAADYLAHYPERIGVVAAEEEFTQRDVSSGRGVVRRLHSDVVFVGLGGGGLAVYRDVYAIDGGAPQKPRDDRLMHLFTTTTSAAVASATTMSEDSARQFISENFRTMEDPMMAFQFLRNDTQSRSTFKLDSIKRTNGVQVAIVKFNEQVKPPLIEGPAHSLATGRFWIDVATGAIRQTELVLSSGHYNLRTTVTLSEEPMLKLWLPIESYQLLDVSGGPGGVSDMGALGGYSGRISLEAQVRYSKFRQRH